MPNTPNEKQNRVLSTDDIASPVSVSPRALDWVDEQLVVGVVLKDRTRAALSSTRGLIPLEQVGRVCERDGNFESFVTPEVATAFIARLKDGSGANPVQEALELLDATVQYFKRFVVFPDEWWPDVLAAWNWGTYVFPIFQAYPYLRLSSPEPGCGKSLLGQMLANVSFNGEFMASPTEAALFHLPEQNRGSQVWDEFELSSQVERNKFQSLKAILLNGYRNGGMVPRQIGSAWETSVKYHVFCPRVLIGLSNLPETVRQRTIELRLQKRKEGQQVHLYRSHIQQEQEKAIRGQSILGALKCASRVAAVYNSEELRKQLEGHLGLVGREVDDIWMPLFAVVAAASTSEKIDFDENPWFRRLTEAARNQAVSRDSKASCWPAATPQTAYRDFQADEERGTLIAALHTLEWARGICPTDLADRVSKGLGRDITAQWLSKKLKCLGIRAKKTGGKRAFSLGAEDVRNALAKLGVESPTVQAPVAGQQGLEGHEPETDKAQEPEQVGVEY
jgi:hypothetical protein